MPTREDSPAHYMEHIQVAMNLLGRRNLPLTDDLGHLDLLRLLRSRVRFDLPGGRQLTIGMVPENSSLAGKTIRALYQQLKQYDFEVIAIMRREHVLLPHPDTLLETKDRVILIVSKEAEEPLSKYVVPIPQIEQSGGTSTSYHAA